MDAVPVEERPDYVSRAELHRAIALLCFTPHAGRYVQPHVPRLFLEAMMPARLFKKLKSKGTVLMRASNTRLGVPRRTAAEARDDTTPSRYVGSFGTCTDIYRFVHPPRKIRWNRQKGPPTSRGKSGKPGNSSNSIPLKTSPSRHKMLRSKSRQLLPSTRPSSKWPSTMLWCLHMWWTLCQYFCPCIKKMST